METTENKQPEITPEQILQQKRKQRAYVVYPLFFLIFAGVIYTIFTLTKKEEKEEGKQETVAGYNADIPQPSEAGIIGDKKSAYELAQMEESKQQKKHTLADFSERFAEEPGENVIEITDEETSTRNNNGGSNQSFQNSTSAYRNMNRELNTLYQPTQENAERERLAKQVEELTERLEVAESPKGKTTTDEQLQLMEKSYEMASRYLNTGGQQPDNVSEATSTATAGKGDKSKVTPVTNVQHRTVSGLEQTVSDSMFVVTYGKPRNLGFITAVGNREAQVTRNTIRACVYADQTLIFGQEEGKQYISLRLLEPMQAGAVTLPRNSIVSGAAKLQSGRIDLEVVSIEYGGYIIPVELTVYDTDGQPGINTPGSAEINAAKDAAANVGAGLGTSVSFSQNAGQQVVADLTKGIMQSGSQYLSKKIKTVKIRLKAGYQVLLLAKES